MDIAEAKKKFKLQKRNAATRGIAWRLTFDDWLAWWGDDLDRRGRGHDELQMQRPHDRGAYELGNIVKGYPRDNSRTMRNCMLNREQQAIAHTKFLRELSYESDSHPVDADSVDEDSQELDAMFGVRSSFGKAPRCYAADKRRA